MATVTTPPRSVQAMFEGREDLIWVRGGGSGNHVENGRMRLGMKAGGCSTGNLLHEMAHLIDLKKRVAELKVEDLLKEWDRKCELLKKALA